MARAAWIMMLMISIGAAVLMFQASGYAGLYGSDPTAGLEPLGDSVKEEANNSRGANKPDAYGGAASGSDEPLINFILDGGGAVLSVFNLVGALPNALIAFGLPRWFAQPIGYVAQIIMGLGAVQFITGRVLK